MITLTKLYRDRCYVADGKLVPHFWKPQPVFHNPYTLWGDDRLPVKSDWGVEGCIPKIIALGLALELPVGEFVLAATNRDIPEGVERSLLKSNVADEARHYEGFLMAAKSYQVDDTIVAEANHISAMWEEVQRPFHPLEAPQILETGIFLISLGILRLCGGRSLATLSSKISEDERRHVTTNRTILSNLDISPNQPPQLMRSLTNETLAWIFSGLSIPPDQVGEKVNLDFLIQASTSLIETGTAEDFNDVVFLCDHILPFEVQNSTLYSRDY